MGGSKNKTQKTRTKGNVKPSSSEKSANFLVQKTGSLSCSQFGGDVTGDGGISFGRLAAYVPIDHDPDAANIDPDIRMQLRKMDKRDAITKQKALGDLIPLLETEKSEEAVLSALPYWPRIYARLAMDEDRKVRELSQKALAGFTSRVGRNLAPYLKQLLPPWVMSQCDLFEPAAMIAEKCFQATFPPHKQKDAYLHCWTEMFTQVEETLANENLPAATSDDSTGESSESKYARTVMACVRTLAKLLPFLKDNEEAEERLTTLLKSKSFWRHTKPNISIINAAYYHLTSTTCQQFPGVAQACCVQLCEVTLRHVDEDNPVTVAALWEALLSVLNNVDQVWKFVSFKKSFSPKLINILQDGGNGCARIIYPNMLPLLSKLPLSIIVPDDAKVLIYLLTKMNEGLHKERVIVSSADSNAVASAILECTRFLIAEAIKGENLDVARELLEEVVVPLLLECLHVFRSKSFAESVFSQSSRLLQFLQKTSPKLSLVIKSHLLNWISIYGKDLHFTANLVNFIVHFIDPTIEVTTIRKQVSFITDFNSKSDSKCDFVVSSDEDAWKVEWLLELQVLLEDMIVNDAPQCLMPYFCISSRLPTVEKESDRVLNRTVVFKLCPVLLEEDVLTTRQVCRTIGVGIADILANVPDPGCKIREFFTCLSDNKAVLFLSKIFPWITHDAKSSNMSEVVLTALESEIIRWGYSLTENVFTKQKEEFQSRLQTLLNIIFKSSSGDFVSLLNLRNKFVQDVTRCLNDLKQPLSKQQRYFVADNLYSFLCLQEFDNDFQSWVPLVLKLVELYSQYLSIDSRPTECTTQSTDSGDDANDNYIWTKINVMIGDTCKSLLQHREECEEMLIDFQERLWSLLMKSVSTCTRNFGLNSLEKLTVNLLTILVDNAEQSDLTQVLKYCFDFVDAAVCQLSHSVQKNCRFHYKLYYTDQEEFSALLRSLHLIHTIITSDKFNIEQLIPDFWLPFTLTISLLDGSLQLETADTVDLYDCLRLYVLNTLCVEKKETIINNLIDMCTGNYSGITYFKLIASYQPVILRIGLLFCIPNKPSCWPHGLQSKLKSLLTDWPVCSEEEFHLAIEVFIPAAACGRILVKESVIALLHQTADDTNITLATVIRSLRLMSELVQLDSSYLISVLPILMIIKEKHNLMVEDVEDLRDSKFCKLDTTIIVLWILYKGVQSSPIDITADQLDFTLCLTSSLTSLISSDLKNKIFSSEDNAVLGFHVFSLISALGLALPCINMENVLNEWNDFFSLHIFQELLPMFVEMATDTKFTNKGSKRFSGLVSEALSSCICVCPKPRLLENSLPPLLFADDPVMLPVTIQCLINTMFPLLYHTRQSVQLGAFNILHIITEDLAKLLGSESDSDEIELPLAITRNLVHLVSSGGLLEILHPTTWGSTSILVKWGLSRHAELSGFLLTWRLLLTIFRESSASTRAKLATWLLDKLHFNNLMDCLYRMMPANPICSLRETASITSLSQPRLSTTNLNLTEDEPTLLERVNDYRSMFQLQHLACHLYRRCLQDAPAVARMWWLAQNKMVAAHCERYTERYVTPYLCRVQIDEVNKMASELTSDAASVEIKGRPAAREVQAVYQMADNHTIELIVVMPPNYPLGQVTVESGRKVGVTTQQWRSWLLQLTIFLQNHNGSILQGLQLWKMNLDKKFEGVEDCMICYSILHGTTFNLPRLQCRVCKKRFHYTCMYKWFTTSQNPTCPLCRNLFYDIPHAWNRIQFNQTANDDDYVDA